MNEDKTLGFQQNPRGNINKDGSARVKPKMTTTTWWHDNDNDDVGHDDDVRHNIPIGDGDNLSYFKVVTQRLMEDP